MGAAAHACVAVAAGRAVLHVALRAPRDQVNLPSLYMAIASIQSLLLRDSHSVRKDSSNGDSQPVLSNGILLGLHILPL